LKSFLFTVKNPHNIPPRRFELKPEKKHQAIYRFSENACFGFGCDLVVCENCNAVAKNYTYSLGNTYKNDTGIDSLTLLTGSRYFQVQEIEVFQIGDHSSDDRNSDLDERNSDWNERKSDSNDRNLH
jgi:hypothetical protein